MFFFFQAEDGIRDLVRSRGLGDVYKRQHRPDLDGLVADLPERAGVGTHQQGLELLLQLLTLLSLIHI